MRLLVFAFALLLIAVGGVAVTRLPDRAPSAHAGVEVSRDCWVAMIAYEFETGGFETDTSCSDPIAPGVEDWTCAFGVEPIHCEPIGGGPEFVDCAINGNFMDCQGEGTPDYGCFEDGASSINCGALDGPTVVCTLAGNGMSCQVLDGQGDYDCTYESSESFFSCVTVAPVFLIFGDTDCGGAFNIGDAINIARDQVNLPVNQQPDCPGLDQQVVVGDDNIQWGNANCKDGYNIGDAIVVARKLIGLPNSVAVGCPELGVQVEVG
jgi:hypothetical protein